MDTQASTLNLTRIRLFTALASVLLSLQAVYFDDILNDDGIMYLQMADAYLSGGFAAVVLIYDWPVFSILIAWLHQLTSISLESCGFIINSILFVLLTDALVLISSLLISSQRQLVIAAILVLCFIPINEYRDFIMRDPGYWAFSSLALYQFMLFATAPNYRAATLWQLFIITAILFRIEGVVILLTLPLFLLFINPISSAIGQLFQSLYLAIGAAIMALLLLTTQTDLSEAFGKLESILSYLTLDHYINLLNQSSTILKQQILNQYSGRYASFILVSGLLAMLAYKLLKTFSISYLILYFTASSKGLSWYKPRLQKLLLYLFLVNILVLSTFLFKHYFVSSRYAIFSLISLLLLIMYPLCHGIEQLWLNRKKLLLSVVALCLTYNVVDATTFSGSKTFIKETAIWAANHLPANSLVMTDDEFVLYYFDREKTTSTLCVKKVFRPTDFTREDTHKMRYLQGPCADGEAHDYKYYDYLIVVEKERYPKLVTFLKTLSLEQIYYQENVRLNDGASVYKVIK
jgi:hypothetical protein